MFEYLFVDIVTYTCGGLQIIDVNKVRACTSSLFGLLKHLLKPTERKYRKRNEMINFKLYTAKKNKNRENKFLLVQSVSVSYLSVYLHTAGDVIKEAFSPNKESTFPLLKKVQPPEPGRRRRSSLLDPFTCTLYLTLYLEAAEGKSTVCLTIYILPFQTSATIRPMWK